MLTITDITKTYRTGSLTQRALDKVSLSLRDNEFVAILGQSGSGKTTLLNIIGGLDRYDKGDLVINGVSTKKYSDRDWDSYRNHTVGFVFQSYNLIPHQTVLKNVELALTISGIPSKDRTARAREALEKVGLAEHIHKKPSQLSGGQMQRVAIARALVNNPQILLADEPTGALDSDTSIQVMDLLKEVARDRLVVMVTHNPELAEQYATRIVTLKDGQITSDSDPFTPEQGKTVHKNLGKASMSFLTSLHLSFNNLWTKKARTILVSFAGSIGIIGIAMILAISTGANEYIRSVEEESLQSYPLTISDTTFNLLSAYTEMSAGVDDSADAGTQKKDVDEWSVVTNLFSSISNNDLRSLKAYFESGECDIYDYVQALEYSYNITPQIYKTDGDSYRQVNPDQAIASLGFSGSEGNMNSMLSSVTSGTDSFFALPRTKALYQNSYDLKAGKWPEAYNECVLMLSSSGRISDMALYIMGLKDPAQLDEIMRAFSEGVSSGIENVPGSYSYDELLGAEFKLVAACDCYTYEKDYQVWSNHSTDKAFMTDLLKDAETLRVVGIVQPRKGAATSGMNVGFGYTAELTDHIIEHAAQSEIVKAQLAQPNINIFTGKPFEEENSSSNEMNLASLFSVDQEAISSAFHLDPDALDLSGIDMSSADFGDLDLSGAFSSLDMSDLMPDLSADDIADLFSDVSLSVTGDDLKAISGDILAGYKAYTADDPKADLNALPASIAMYLASADGRERITGQLTQIIAAKQDSMITPQSLADAVEYVAAGYPDYLSELGLEDDGSYRHLGAYLSAAAGQNRITAAAAKLREQMRSSLLNTDELSALAAAIIDGYEAYAQQTDLPSPSHMLGAFTDYLQTANGRQALTKAAAKMIGEDVQQQIMQKLSQMMAAKMEAVSQRVMGAVSTAITEALTNGMAELMSGLSENLLSAFNFDPAQLSQMFKSNLSATELKDLMVSMFSDTARSYDANLKVLGYADIDKPASIVIYPRDFESKTHIKELISDYNNRMEASGQKEKVIQYTDIVDALMSTVTVIIDVISYVLIAFVSISLVVSSIMIGVITYISVLERRKEIGILRAIGASKRNISQVFNAETFIIGALAGMIGVVITWLLIIPSNIIIHSASGVNTINAVLSPFPAVLLVLLSIVLTLIGGFIPARKAAKSDPVTALRSE